jgi:hypothetical protein
LLDVGCGGLNGCFLKRRLTTLMAKRKEKIVFAVCCIKHCCMQGEEYPEPIKSI